MVISVVWMGACSDTTAQIFHFRKKKKRSVILSACTLTNLTEPVYQKLVTLSPQFSQLGTIFLVAAVRGVGVEDLRCKSKSAISRAVNRTLRYLAPLLRVHPEQELDRIHEL